MVIFPCNGNHNLDCFYWYCDKEAFEMRELKQFLRGAKKGMKDFGQGIALIINSVLLTVVYFVGVGFTAIFAKLFRKHFLDMKLSKKKTYWSGLNLKKRPIEEYYRQF